MGSHRKYKSTGLATEGGGFTQGWVVPNCAQRLVQQVLAPDAGEWGSVVGNRVGGPGAGEARR